MNKRYIKGANFERKIVNEARAKGFLSFRSAGSHSPFDVVIIEKNNIKFIQCKKGKLNKSEFYRIKNELKMLSGVYLVSFELLHQPDKRKRK